MSYDLLPGYTLPAHHPFVGREAFQCDVCHGIFYPDPVDLPADCPYCAEEEGL